MNASPLRAQIVASAIVMIIAACVWAVVMWSALHPPPEGREGTASSSDGGSPVTLPSCAPRIGQPDDATRMYLQRSLAPTGGATATSIAYLRDERLLVLLGTEDGSAALSTVALPGDAAGALPVRGSTTAATGMSSDGRRLYIAGDGGVVERVDVTAGIATPDATHFDLGTLGIGEPAGLAFDRTRAELLVPDPASRRVVRVGVSAADPSSASPSLVACELTFATMRPTAVAVRGSDAHVFVASEGAASLLELGPDGEPIAEIRVADVSLGAVRGMAFAPTADPTDHPDAQDLYLLAQETSGLRLQVIGIEAPAPARPRTTIARALNSISTAALTPPSSDPGGIAWDDAGGRFIVTDSDVDENSDYAGHVAFALDPGAAWTGLGVPTGTLEVSDVAVDPEGGRWFLSDDGADLVVEVDLGEDAEFGTADDRVRSFDTTAFGSDDPEGLGFGQWTIFISDGDGAEIYRLAPGQNGYFDGTAPGGDDTVTSFDTARHGVTDPESVAYDPERGTLFVMSRRQQEPIIEVTTSGELVTVITVEGDLVSPAGLTIAPSLDGSGARSLFVADRGEDNAQSDHPNDGRIVEFQLEL